MKKQLYTTVLFLFFVMHFLAQNTLESKEKIKALKVSFLTQELLLNAEIAQKFWPIYNKHQNNLENLRDEGRSEIRKKLRDIDGLDALSETEAKILVNSRLDLDKKICLEKELFLTEISKILSYKKILKLQLSEREFAKKLMHKYGRNKE